jgi:hypothetical protein
MAKPGAWGLGSSGGKSKPAKQPPAAQPPAAPPPAAPPPPTPAPVPQPQAPAAFTPLPISFKGVNQAKKDPTYTAVAAELGIKKLDNKKELQRVVTELSARKTAADQAAAAAAPVKAPVFTPQRTNSLTPFLNPETGGLGLNFYNQAKAAGMSASQIATLIPGSGAAGVGDLAQQALQRDIEEEKTSKLREYEAKFEDARQQYEAKFESSMQQYRAGLQEAQTRSTQLAGELSSAQAAREEARTRADAIEKQRREEQEVSVGQQLSGLRSGSTMGGTPGAGLGSLTSGGSALSGRRSLGRGAAEQGGVLASYRRSIDPTDSVLDKDVVVDSMTRGGGSGRSEARRRALASGGGGSYYASRFG